MNPQQLTVLLRLATILVAGTALTRGNPLLADVPDQPRLPPTAASLLKFFDRIEITAQPGSGKLITTLVNDHPEKFVWTGQADGRLVAAAVRQLPKGPVRKRAAPALMEFVQAKMVSEVLKTKAILDVYAKHGLTETAALHEAVEEAAGQLNLVGSLKGFTSKASIEEGCAVGYLVADEANVIAHLAEENKFLNTGSVAVVEDAQLLTLWTRRHERQTIVLIDWSTLA